MNSETQFQKVKSCNACKRTLPIHFFGIRKFSKDGYNPTCKDCRNFRRRQAYKTPDNSDDPCYPLNEHNKKFLWTISESKRKVELLGLQLNSLEAFEVLYEFHHPQIFKITLKMYSSSYTHIHGGTKDEFIAFALLLMDRFNIRLFHPDDSIALSNWGMIKNHRVQF